jgi:hypothetical protein
VTSTLRDDASRRRAFVLGCVFAVGLAAVALVLVVQERVSDDPWGPGTVHDVKLVRQTSPCPALWVIAPDDDHRWQNDTPVPASWTGDAVEGTLDVSVEFGEATFTADRETVRLYGGKQGNSGDGTAGC